MKIKIPEKRNNGTRLSTRMLVAFAAMVIIPVCLIGLSMASLLSARLETYGQQYGVSNLSYNEVANNTGVLAHMTNEQYAVIKDASAAGAVKLEDTAFLDGINKELDEMKSFLIVRKEADITYNGGGERSQQFLATLPDFGNEGELEEGWTAVNVNEGVLIRQADFIFGDGSEGSAFIVTDINQTGPVFSKWVRDLCIVCIIILSFTALLMGWWLYMSITGPLSSLRSAVRNIGSGNLDFTVSESSITEFNEVCADFDEMRIQLRNTRDEKAASDNSHKELISNITHDLKTPITSIKGYCEGIMDGVADTPEKMEKYIHTIYNKAVDMDRLINELSVYSNIDTNRIIYSFTKINVRGYFDDCASDLSDELESEGIRMEYTNTVSPGAVIIGDPEQLARVIHNIISNSVKYMDKEERFIKIRIMEEGDFIRAEFEDNGKGISKKEIGRIFDRFYRTDASRNSSQGGSGIGLSIVKKILEDHGGKVWAGSVEGEGTTIYFILRKYQETGDGPVSPRD